MTSRFLLSKLTLVLALAWPAGIAHAHHGRDFLVVQDFFLPDFLGGVLTSSFEASQTGDFMSYNVEPQVLFGVAPGAAVGLSASYADEAGLNWVLESLAPAFYLQLTPRASDFPFRIAVGGSYQFALGGDGGHSSSSSASSSASGSAGSSSSSRGQAMARVVAKKFAPKVGKASSNPDDPGTVPHDHSTHDHGTAAQSGSSSSDSGNSSGASAGASTFHHHHGGGGTIHLHGQEAFLGTLIVETDFTDRDKFVFNLISAVPMEGTSAWGYSAGIRHNVTHSVSVSFEATGDFSPDGYQEVNIGGFFVPRHDITLRAGIGMGLNEQSPDLLLRTGIVWRF